VTGRLDSKVAVVAGAGRGIGRAIALAFAREGASLVLVARTRSELDIVSEECRSLGAAAEVATADVTNGAQVAAAMAAADRLGPLDVLVNAAGVYGPIGPTWEVEADAWRAAVDVNLDGTFLLCREALSRMVSAGSGTVILLGGGGATAPLPRLSAYSASKAGVARLAETLAEETRELGIRVNVIAPGLVDTTLQDEVLAAGARAGALFEKVKDARATGAGTVSPEVAAELAVFLASDESGPLTGKLISAPHDPWREWGARAADLNRSPMFTLRRLDPFTIGPLIAELA
jgi:NAD(P)-dependent dehydrogenase (short-subunit alcohol dehydrogenase family)